MAEQVGSGVVRSVQASEAAAGVESAATRWAAVGGVPQSREDRLPAQRAALLWNQIYALFGADSEDMRDEVFLAVNMYFWSNGCSPDGKYERNIRTGGGVEVSAGAVVKITGRLPGEIRQFLRGLMKKSYECLKYSPVVKEDAVMADKAEALGVPRAQSWLLADWLRNCEYLTAQEASLQEGVANRLIARANQRRKEKPSVTGTHYADEEEEVVPAMAGPSQPFGSTGFPTY